MEQLAPRRVDNCLAAKFVEQAIQARVHETPSILTAVGSTWGRNVNLLIGRVFLEMTGEALGSFFNLSKQKTDLTTYRALAWLHRYAPAGLQTAFPLKQLRLPTNYHHSPREYPVHLLDSIPHELIYLLIDGSLQSFCQPLPPQPIKPKTLKEQANNRAIATLADLTATDQEVQAALDSLTNGVICDRRTRGQDIPVLSVNQLLKDYPLYCRAADVAQLAQLLRESGLPMSIEPKLNNGGQETAHYYRLAAIHKERAKALLGEILASDPDLQVYAQPTLTQLCGPADHPLPKASALVNRDGYSSPQPLFREVGLVPNQGRLRLNQPGSKYYHSFAEFLKDCQEAAVYAYAGHRLSHYRSRSFFYPDDQEMALRDYIKRRKAQLLAAT